MWFAVALILVVVMLVSPPLVLAKKLSGGHPASTGKEITRCNPCPFNSINRSIYEINVTGGTILHSYELMASFVFAFSENTVVSDFATPLAPPLRC